MEYILEVVTLNGLFRIEEVEELLHELGCDVDFEGSNLDRLVDDKLEEEFVDALKMGPGGIHLLLLVNTSLRKVQIALFDVGKGSENVLLNHLHHFVEVGDDHANYIFLVL